jgi:hypothetical protein
MVKSYDVSFHLDENLAGWYLTCFEGDEIVHEEFFRDSEDAHFIGHRFLDGLYVKGFSFEDANFGA